LVEGSIDDLAPEAMAEAKTDCAGFQSSFASLLRQAYASKSVDYDETRAGADFWFTRNGHGVGFWDRDLGDIGDKLGDMARPYGSTGLYRGDDDQIYLY
jgi:hypothetical protein